MISFDAAASVDAHVHRVGRTGREGQAAPGLAVTLLTHQPHDARQAGSLVTHLELSGQAPSEQLLTLAMTVPAWAARRRTQGPTRRAQHAADGGGPGSARREGPSSSPSTSVPPAAPLATAEDDQAAGAPPAPPGLAWHGGKLLPAAVAAALRSAEAATGRFSAPTASKPPATVAEMYPVPKHLTPAGAGGFSGRAWAGTGLGRAEADAAEAAQTAEDEARLVGADLGLGAAAGAPRGRHSVAGLGYAAPPPHSQPPPPPPPPPATYGQGPRYGHPSSSHPQQYPPQFPPQQPQQHAQQQPAYAWGAQAPAAASGGGGGQGEGGVAGGGGGGAGPAMHPARAAMLAQAPLPPRPAQHPQQQQQQHGGAWR